MEFSPLSGDVVKILKKYWHLLFEVPGCDKFPVIGYKRTRSLRDLLTKTEFEIDTRETQTNIVSGHHLCGHCSVCYMNVKTVKTEFPELGFTHNLTQFSNCQTRMCIYLLSCFCKLRYVGSTQRPLKVCLLEHKSRIKNEIKEAPLVQHCVDMKHEFKDFCCVVLKVITVNAGMHSDLNKRLLQRELFWIMRLKTLTPGGLNQDVDYNVVL